MQFGMELRDRQGRVIFDTQSQLGRFVGTVPVVYRVNGFVDVPNANGDKIFYLVGTPTPVLQSGTAVPTFSITNNRISWAWSAGSSTFSNTWQLFYGIY